MGKCKFCGKPAGFLKSSHKMCRLIDEKGRKEADSTLLKIQGADVDSALLNIQSAAVDAALLKIQRAVESAAQGRCDLNLMYMKVAELCEINGIDEKTLKNSVIAGWEMAVEKAFDDGLLTEEEHGNLDAVLKHFSLTQEDLNKNGVFTKLVKGAVLRDVISGMIPERVKIKGELPFTLLATEKLIWIFQGVKYYEERQSRCHAGGSQSTSIRVANGFYYRTSGFQKECIETHGAIQFDSGLLGVTNKHLYFSGTNRHFRIALDRIASFQPFSDGFALYQFARNANAQLFATGDGWFTYNLVINLAQRCRRIT
jgi:hypothetical protein